MKYYIIAGEASGDLHGSNLIKELKKLDSTADIRCWGGEKMQDAGGTLVKHYRDLAFMGFTEVLMNLTTIIRNISFCKQDITTFSPDVLILVDYPGFNLRIAKWAKLNRLRVVYYISPQVWAWKENRVHAIKKYVDRMLVILPFEKEFYRKWNYEVTYVGHPLVEVIEDYLREHNEKPVLSTHQNAGTIALLPGSRQQEILKKLPIMLAVAANFPKYRFVVAKAPGLEAAFYDELLKDFRNVNAVSGKTYGLLADAKAALVTSGTATLETALFAVPQVICYRGGTISYHIAKRLIKIKYIGLVNLIMDKPVVKELIQEQLTVENLSIELDLILHNAEKKAGIQKDYANLKNLLVAGGNASSNAARQIFSFVKD